MQNCPNCGAPWNPYSYRCEYCGTYAFDTTAWNIEEGTPCYVKIKTDQGVITTLARPIGGCIDVHDDRTLVTDSLGTPYHSFITGRTCRINMNFECIMNPKTRELFRVQK